MMRYIECPESVHLSPMEISVFMAGGITGCDDWQTKMLGYLACYGANGTFINPRRYSGYTPEMEQDQITWEYMALSRARCTSFWFPSETLCPITLFELGKQLGRRNKVFVGCHPEYKRINDIRIQLSLELGDRVQLVTELSALAKQVSDWTKTFETIRFETIAPVAFVNDQTTTPCETEV